MLKYKHLESSKYWEAKAKAEIMALRRERDRDAARSFMLFLGFLLAVTGFGYALQHGLFADLDSSQLIQQVELLINRWFG